MRASAVPPFACAKEVRGTAREAWARINSAPCAFEQQGDADRRRRSARAHRTLLMPMSHLRRRWPQWTRRRQALSAQQHNGHHLKGGRATVCQRAAPLHELCRVQLVNAQRGEVRDATKRCHWQSRRTNQCAAAQRAALHERAGTNLLHIKRDELLQGLRVHCCTAHCARSAARDATK